MMKIDVAINSYKKPESLIYTLMTLKKTAGDMIDTVYINDDRSRNGALEIYKSPQVKEYFSPWKIDVRENTKNIGIKQAYIRGYYPPYMDWKFKLKRWYRFFSPEYGHNRYDIRYQYALEHTDKKYLLILHDDVKFMQNVVKVYLERFAQNPELTIVGDFGQCWRCHFKPFCNRKNVVEGRYPSPHCPLTPSKEIARVDDFNPKEGYTYACRINEWCCMVDVAKANTLTEQSRAFFFFIYPHSDTAAYWFALGVKLGYKFDDPLLDNRKEYYQHAWQGFSGHSVWVNQGQGKSVYDKQGIIDLIEKEFGFIWPEEKDEKEK